jgi:hypothetical protein
MVLVLELIHIKPMALVLRIIHVPGMVRVATVDSYTILGARQVHNSYQLYGAHISYDLFNN